MYDFLQARAMLQLLHGNDALIEFRFPWPHQRVKTGEQRPAPHPIDRKYKKIIYAVLKSMESCFDKVITVSILFTMPVGKPFSPKYKSRKQRGQTSCSPSRIMKSWDSLHT